MAAWLLAFSVLASLAAALLAVAAWLWVTRQVTSIPGPPTLPLLGNALIFYKQPVLQNVFAEIHKRYGDIFRLYAGPKLLVMITRPEDVQQVIGTSRLRERDKQFVSVLKPVYGDGLTSINGEMWKRHRKLLERAFHAEVLQQHMDTFNTVGRILCDQLAASGGAQMDLYPSLALAALRTIMATVLDVDLDRVEPDQHKQAAVPVDVLSYLKMASVTLTKPWMSIEWIRKLTPQGREMNRIASASRNNVIRACDIARKELANIKARGRSPIINLFPEVNPEQPITYEELFDEITTLLVAGTDTVATVMGFILTLLGLHPEWQDLAWRELDDVFGKEGDCSRPVIAADLPQLTVIDAIIKETMRLFSLGPIVPDIVSEDITLGDGRYVVPRGTCVLVNLFLMHRRPDLFPDPDKFDPGRFLPGGSATNRKPGSYLPFGAGSRVCVAARLANLEMRVLLAMVLRRFRVLPGSTREELEQIPVSVTAHPITSFRVSCIPRDDLP